MATDLNNVMLIGRLVSDPTQKYLPSGMAVAEFSIANNYYVSSKNSTEVTFGKSAETVAKYLTKGKQIAISGTLRQERWQDKDTNTGRSKVRIIMNTMQMLGSSSGSGGASSPNMDATYTPSSMGNSVDIGGFSDDDEVPF